LRVLEGQVAALVETAREEAMPINSLPDLSTAYLGIPLRKAVPPPVLPEAMLAISPARLELAAPAEVLTRSLGIDDSLSSGRCLSYEATSDANWLRLEPSVGTFPGDATIVVDPSAFGPGDESLIAQIQIAAVEPGVLDSPQVLRVVIQRGDVGPAPAIYLPSLFRDGPIDR
jgi:hypothetical protein